MKQEHLNNKHLTYEEREYIEIRLGQGKSFAEIGKDIISIGQLMREVQNRKYKKVSSKFNNSESLCKHRQECRMFKCTPEENKIKELGIQKIEADKVSLSPRLLKAGDE